jgi:flagellar assembly factor FliW
MESIQTTTVDLPRFGELTYAETDVIEFPWGIPGFPTLRRWLLLNFDSNPGFVWMQNLEDANVAIPTVEPHFIFESYDPKLPPYAFVALDIKNPEDFTLLCVVVVTADAQEMTTNLMAPVVVNLRNRMARQVMLDNSTYSVREPVPRKPAPAPSSPAANV